MAEAVAGPSAEDWQTYRTRIVDLYLTGSLKEVMSEMERRYGFIATKRMYDIRFRKWGVNKIIKGAEKERIARAMQSADEDAQVKLSPKDYRKVMRHMASRSRERERGKMTMRRPVKSNAERIKASKEGAKLGGDALENLDVSVEDSSPDFDGIADHGNCSLRSHGGPRSTRSTSSLQTTPPSDSSPMFINMPPKRSSTVIAQRHQSLSHSPQPALILSPAAKNQELILHNLTSYYTSRLDELQASSDPLHSLQPNILATGASTESRSFWANIKDGIYLWKIHLGSSFPDPERKRYKILHRANQLADSALTSEPLDFPRDVLSALSPTNTLICPALRTHILGYLCDKALVLLGPRHPVTSLCEALLRDDGDPLASRLGLNALLDLFIRRLGPAHPASLKLTDTLITLMRRSGELETARSWASDAFGVARRTYGERSDEAHIAAVELAHIWTKMGEHGRALALRLSIVEEPVSAAASGVALSAAREVRYRRDGIACRTMEDLAEYYVRFGNSGEAMWWLRFASAIARDIWGERSSTREHIEDKLANLNGGVMEGQVVAGEVVVAT